MKWELLHRVPKGHKFFRREGKIYVADYSGKTPDKTDDGPLQLLTDKPIVVVTNDNLSHSFLVPVLAERGNKERCVSCSVREMRYLIDTFDMELVLRSEDDDLKLRATPACQPSVTIETSEGPQVIEIWCDEDISIPCHPGSPRYKLKVVHTKHCLENNGWCGYRWMENLKTKGRHSE